ncbi:MAG: class I SAM-dependent methyltransferase [Patescibacteria group bacterium]|nr:class I SAM-dependent methyltransferase [Patescibacteria group bacterium]
MNKLLQKTLSRPAISIIIRKILENNFKRQKEIIKKYFLLDLDDKILDVGCGTGEFSIFFPAQNYTGIDLDPQNIKFAKAHYQGNFLVADATNLPFDDHSFSKVLVVGVFHHLSNDAAERAIKEIKRVLKLDGKFLVMEDTASSNIFTKFLHRLDQGEFIRSGEQWFNLFSQNWKVAENFKFNNGICYYSCFLLER